MKKGFLKKTTAVALGAAMALAPITALADDGATGTGAIFSYKVTKVVVPTTYTFAMNPDGLPIVQTGVTDPVTDQIVSQSVGIINKSSYDQVVKVELTVTDLNAADQDTPQITFVDKESDITSAGSGEYKVLLQLLPADSSSAVSQYYDGTTATDINTTTDAAALANVVMTANTNAAVALTAGDNEVSFKLPKASYALASGSAITLGTDTANDVESKFELTANGGITAFKLGGKMNANADWTKLTEGVKIDAVYEFSTVTGSEKAVAGTAMVTVPTSVTLNGGVVTITGLTAKRNYVNAEFTIVNNSTEEETFIDVNKMLKQFTWVTDAYTKEKGGTLQFVLPDTWVSAGTVKNLVVTLSDGTTISPAAGPEVSLDGKTISVTNLEGENNMKDIKVILNKDGNETEVSLLTSNLQSSMTWDTSAWTSDDGGDISVTLKEAWDAYGTISSVIVVLEDESTIIL